MSTTIKETQVVVVTEEKITIVTIGIQGAPGIGGSLDHGAMTGLGDDDHPQYHTDARGDARYFTQAQVTAALAGKQPLAAVLTATTAAFTTAQETKLSGIEPNATGDQTGAEIVSAIDATLGSPEWKTQRTLEEIQDIVAAMFQGGTHTNLSVVYDDSAGTLSLTASGGGGGGLNQEQAEDIVANLVAVAGGGINVVYDDPSGTLTFSLSGESYTTAEKNKLAGIAAGATVNSSDAALRDRATHTGVQSATTITEATDKRFVTDNQKDALNAANSPSGTNPLATIADIVGNIDGGVPDSIYSNTDLIIDGGTP